MVIWWYGLIWYVLRSPLRPLARPCILDASISCSQNPISPEDVIERTRFLSFFYKSPNTVDGRNPAPPGMYKTLCILGYRSYITWFSRRISFTINSSNPLISSPRYRSTTKSRQRPVVKNSLWTKWHLGHLYHLSFKFCTKWCTDLLTDLEISTLTDDENFFGIAKVIFFRLEVEIGLISEIYALVGGWTTNPSDKICASQNGFIFPLNRDDNIFFFWHHHLVLL